MKKPSLIVHRYCYRKLEISIVSLLAAILILECSPRKKAEACMFCLIHPAVESTSSSGVLVAAPGFSIADGTYDEGQQLSIESETTNATIRYTTDGSDPTELVGLAYTGPIQLSISQTFKARAFMSGCASSTVSTGTYRVRSTAFKVKTRDFKASHPDFEKFIGNDTGIVSVELSADGTPVYASPTNTATTTGAANFHSWFHDTPGTNIVIDSSMPTTPLSGSGPWQFSSGSLFPIDGSGWGNEGNPHNYHYTMHISSGFLVEDNTKIDIIGDDDIWVFINGHLLIDLGGVHGALSGNITLDSTKRQTLGLSTGELARIDIFRTERHTTASNFSITISSPLFRL